MKKAFFYIAAGRPAQCNYFKIKVGISDNPEKRIKALRTDNYMLELFAALKFENLDIPRRLERLCIEGFKESRWLETYPDGRGHIVRRYRQEYFEGFPRDFLNFAVAAIPAGEKFVRVI